MKWTTDGQRICIIYEDGAVIVGSVDGNRLWGKELTDVRLYKVEWSPNGKYILFGTGSSDIHVYDNSGTFVVNHCYCIVKHSTNYGLSDLHFFFLITQKIGSPKYLYLQ